MTLRTPSSGHALARHATATASWSMPAASARRRFDARGDLARGVRRLVRMAASTAMALVLSFVLSLAVAPPAHGQGCRSDLNGDGTVDAADLAILLGDWGLACSPAITAVSPSSGEPTGGTVITLTGEGLLTTTSVTIGGAACTNLVVLSSTEVRATTPPGKLGARTIVLTTADGRTTEAPTPFIYYVTPSWATPVEAVPDPAIVYDAELRAAIIATGWAWKVLDNGTGIEMVLIPPGTYDMGCSASNLWGCDNWENPVHPVTITQPFYMSRTEVTQAQWTPVMGSNPSYVQSASVGVPGWNRPVEQVSWNTIQGFLSATGMRLPTEAEWEYAYRAGTTTAFHGWAGQTAGTNDDTLVGSIAWYASNSPGTRPVGGKAANGFGLHDMAGNVWEWVSDYYSESYYASSPLEDPQGPTSGSSRVVRGGSWLNPTSNVRSSGRLDVTPGGESGAIGFRVARAPL